MQCIYRTIIKNTIADNIENDALEKSMCLLNAAKVTCREKSHDVNHLSLKVKENQLNILKDKRQLKPKKRKEKRKIKLNSQVGKLNRNVIEK